MKYNLMLGKGNESKRNSDFTATFEQNYFIKIFFLIMYEFLWSIAESEIFSFDVVLRHF